MTLIYLSLAFIIGVLMGSNIHLPIWSLVFAFLPLLFLLLKKHTKIIITTSLCLLALLGGVVRYQSNLPVIDESNAQFYNNQDTVTLEGVIATAPDIRDTSTQITVSVRDINGYPVSGKALLFAPRYPEYTYGDVLQVIGKLETPPVLGDFDYKGYLAGQGISSVMYYPQIKVVESGQGFKPLEWVYSVRQTMSQKMTEVLPEPQASLAKGIILGIRSDIPQSIKDDFTRTGTTHILVISGQNLSMVVGLFISTGIWFFGKKRYLYVWLALITTWGYSLLTGMDAPVVRAAVMLSLFLFADLLGRQRSVMPALAFAATVMVVINPLILQDASFQLSFLATLGLALVAPPIQTFGRNIVTSRLGEGGALVSTLNWIVDSLAVTVGVTLVVWPVIAYYFGIFSIVSPLATLLILPVLPAIIVTGAFAAVLGIIIIPVGQVVGWVAWLFLSYMLAVVDWFAGLSIAAIDLGEISPIVLWGYFALLALALWSYHKQKQATTIVTRITDTLAGPSKRFVIPVLLVIATLTTLFAGSLPDDRLHVSFLDVGQGDAILIQKGSQDILVDGGPSPQAISLELGRKLPFWDRTIELVILTHPHADHITGLIEVLKRYHVKHVLYAESDSTSSLWAEWQNLLKEKRIGFTFAQTGQVIDLGDGSPLIEVLNSPGADDDTTMDADCMVLRVSDGKISFLLTADITEEKELGLIMERAQLDSTVLKVAHHGSYTATSLTFLTVVSPQVTVISVGADNEYGHPNHETIERLTSAVGEDNIYRTDLNGTIEFTTDGEKLWLRTEREK
jgi:competence protein ComEC